MNGTVYVPSPLETGAPACLATPMTGFSEKLTGVLAFSVAGSLGLPLPFGSGSVPALEMSDTGVGPGPVALAVTELLKVAAGGVAPGVTRTVKTTVWLAPTLRLEEAAVSRFVLLEPLKAGLTLRPAPAIGAVWMAKVAGLGKVALKFSTAWTFVSATLPRFSRVTV